MNLFTWMLFGLTAGVIANLMDNRPSAGGILGGMILGMAGAFVGGVMATLMFNMDGLIGFNFVTFAIAGVGSLMLLLIARGLRRL